MIRNTLIAAAAVLGLSTLAPAAYAQSGGGGGAIPNQAPATNVLAAPPTFDVGSAGYQRFDGRVIGMSNNQIVPENGSEGIVQTANSLPPGFTSVPVPGAQLENNHVIAVTSGNLIPNNGSGIAQTADSMPVGAMRGTVPQTTSTIVGRYVSAAQARELAARTAAYKAPTLPQG